MSERVKPAERSIRNAVELNAEKRFNALCRSFIDQALVIDRETPSRGKLDPPEWWYLMQDMRRIAVKQLGAQDK